jgi:hypothetical protein
VAEQVDYVVGVDVRCPEPRGERVLQVMEVKIINPGGLDRPLGYRSFDTAEGTLQGVEAANMIRKGQVKRLDGNDAVGQAKFIESRFGAAA